MYYFFLGLRTAAYVFQLINSFSIANSMLTKSNNNEQLRLILFVMKYAKYRLMITIMVIFRYTLRQWRHIFVFFCWCLNVFGVCSRDREIER